MRGRPRKNKEMPKARLLMFGTPRYVGQEGPFVRLTGLWGDGASDIVKAIQTVDPDFKADQKVTDVNSYIRQAAAALSENGFDILVEKDNCQGEWIKMTVNAK